MRFLKQPFPHESSLACSVRLAIRFGVFIFLFLVIFRPFNMDSLPGRTIFISSAVLGLVTFTCIIACDFLLPLLFPDYFREDKWTTGKQIVDVLFVLLVIGSVNFLLFPTLFGGTLNWNQFFYVQSLTVMVGALPIALFTLLKQNVWLKQFKKEAASLQEKLQEKKQEEKPETTDAKHQLISFTGENSNEKFQIEDHQLLYIEAASNYVKLYFEKNGKPNYTIIRNTMKRVEEILQEYAMFFRCHRTYIVNLDKVEAVEGNAQGYKLKITGSDERLPVSRSLNKEFSDRLLAVRPEALS